MADRMTEVRRALLAAPAEGLVERLAEALSRAYGLTGVELYLVDYRLAALLPVTGGRERTAPGDPAWRCFDHQVPVHEDGVSYLPVTMRGERSGVLGLVPAATDEATTETYAEIGTLLAHELAAVRASTDRYAQAARNRRLTLAAEMQWELLPGRSRIGPSFGLAGQLEPAYAVRGDTFDWSDDGHRLWLAVTNGMGEGVAAASLTALATNALRNARRAGLPLAEQAALADQAIFSHHQGAQYVATLLLELDLVTGVVTAVDAGSPRLVLVRGDEVTDQDLVEQFPLGMFDGTLYQPQRFQLRPDDRLFVLSDGVYDAAASAGRYGGTALDRFLRRSAGMAPLQAVRALVADLRAFVGSDLVDDAVVVSLDWVGPDGRRSGQ
ncbi:PP2C family protein-serine/threonine phosphatase [Plantactinospora sp. GCM10030261]|uniref:PP2C family protein-serine/threonine phosphatase n=1 Tax=Plantactinospora sp. GCM10030261 TaxID=3273420 RepID=UPI00360D6D6D